MQIPASSSKKERATLQYRILQCVCVSVHYVRVTRPPSRDMWSPSSAIVLCMRMQHNGGIGVLYVKILGEGKLCARSSAVLIKLTLVLRHTPFTSVCEFLCKTWAHRCHALCAKSTRMALFAKQDGRLSIMTS